VGARIGAAPITSIRREKIRGEGGAVEQVADHRHRDHRRGRDAEALQDAQTTEHRDRRAITHSSRREHVHGDPGNQQRPPPPRVGQRTDQELAAGHADQRAGEGQLYGCGRRVQVGRDRGNAGRYVSIVSGPSATSAPRASTSRTVRGHRRWARARPGSADLPGDG
jgi:hypothetical protein